MTQDVLPTKVIAGNKIHTDSVDIKRPDIDNRPTENNTTKEFVPPDGGVQVNQ